MPIINGIYRWVRNGINFIRTHLSHRTGHQSRASTSTILTRSCGLAKFCNCVWVWSFPDPSPPTHFCSSFPVGGKGYPRPYARARGIGFAHTKIDLWFGNGHVEVTDTSSQEAGGPADLCHLPRRLQRP